MLEAADPWCSFLIGVSISLLSIHFLPPPLKSNRNILKFFKMVNFHWKLQNITDEALFLTSLAHCHSFISALSWEKNRTRELFKPLRQNKVLISIQNSVSNSSVLWSLSLKSYKSKNLLHFSIPEHTCIWIVLSFFFFTHKNLAQFKAP